MIALRPVYVGGQALQWAVDVSYSISNVQVVVDPQIKVENGEKILKERFRVDFSQSVFIINGAHQIWFWMSRSDWQLIALDEQKPGLHQIQSVSQELYRSNIESLCMGTCRHWFCCTFPIKSSVFQAKALHIKNYFLW